MWKLKLPNIVINAFLRLELTKPKCEKSKIDDENSMHLNEHKGQEGVSDEACAAWVSV